MDLNKSGSQKYSFKNIHFIISELRDWEAK